MSEPKQTTLAKKSRLILSFWERLRGWVETLPPGDARGESIDSNRRALNVVRRLKRYGLFTRPVQGIVIHIETAERLADLLDRVFESE
jgi:hypothetical protein